MEKQYVQFGCGLCAPEGWRNFDASPRIRIEKCPIIGKLMRHPLFPRNCEYGDIVKGLPLKAETCDVLYSSHVLEHLSLEDFRTALRNSLVILKPGGVFRAVVPDLETEIKKYLGNNADDRAISFLQKTMLGKEKRPRTGAAWLHEILGNSNHLWMWDFSGLAAELKRAGFIEIRHANYGDLNDAMIDLVENAGRWCDAIGINCRKPK